MTEPVNLPTRREWLAQQGLAKGLEEQAQSGRRGGGRFSKKAHAALEEARAKGQRFADDPVARA